MAGARSVDISARRDSEPHRCELDNGPALALDTARRLACDAAAVGIVEGDDGERFRGSVSGEEPTPRICVLNREAGLRIDPSTGRCRWLGETMDYRLAIEGIQSLRDRAAAAAPASPET